MVHVRLSVRPCFSWSEAVPAARTTVPHAKLLRRSRPRLKTAYLMFGTTVKATTVHWRADDWEMSRSATSRPQARTPPTSLTILSSSSSKDCGRPGLRKRCHWPMRQTDRPCHCGKPSRFKGIRGARSPFPPVRSRQLQSSPRGDGYVVPRTPGLGIVSPEPRASSASGDR